MKSLNHFIRDRASLLKELRCFFDSRGYFEVQPLCLLDDCVVDAYVDPIAVDASELKLAEITVPKRLFLQTSPESAMKQMLAAGAPSIYSIGPVFRSGELGAMHRPEFTMLEWYELGGDVSSAISLLGQLAVSSLERHRYKVQTYQEIFLEHLGIDPLQIELIALREFFNELLPDLAEGLASDRDGMLDALLAERVQPKLGHPHPLVVKNYPRTQAALAKQSPEDPRCASRFELFVDGVELANGYDELQDPNELVQRAEQHNAKRVAAGRPPLKVETGLVQAMRLGLPQCSGVALGVDRLHMLKYGHRDLDGCTFGRQVGGWR